MKFATESKMKTWYQAIDLQKKVLAHPIPNPYAEPPSDDSDDSDEGSSAPNTQPPRPKSPLPRNPIQNYSYQNSQADIAVPSVRAPPAMASNSSHASVAQQHNRSYSTPDINTHNEDRSLGNSTMASQVPAIPGITPHQHHPSRSSILIAPPRLGLRPLIKADSDEPRF